MLYERKIPFGLDFEVVAAAVIDYLTGRGGGGGHCEGMGPARYYADLFGWLQDLGP